MKKLLKKAFETESRDAVVGLIDDLKDLGLEYGTISGHSVSLSDITIPEARRKLIDQGIEKVVLISTDKAAEPANLYGATKLCAEKLFTGANFYSPEETIFSAVRYGNVVGSRGSLVDILKKNGDLKQVRITDPAMTRFWITLKQSFDIVDFAFRNMVGGEIFIPKIPSMKVVDLFDAVVPGVEKETVGIRAGEKLHEVLLTKDESRRAVELDEAYVVLALFPHATEEVFSKYYTSGRKLDAGFSFASDTNKNWLTKEDFKEIIKMANSGRKYAFYSGICLYTDPMPHFLPFIFEIFSIFSRTADSGRIYACSNEYFHRQYSSINR